MLDPEAAGAMIIRNVPNFITTRNNIRENLNIVDSSEGFYYIF
jgi:hypothetical protein